jgi:hypothetical protein
MFDLVPRGWTTDRAAPTAPVHYFFDRSTALRREVDHPNDDAAPFLARTRGGPGIIRAGGGRAMGNQNEFERVVNGLIDHMTGSGFAAVKPHLGALKIDADGKGHVTVDFKVDDGQPVALTIERVEISWGKISKQTFFTLLVGDAGPFDLIADGRPWSESQVNPPLALRPCTTTDMAKAIRMAAKKPL